MSWKEPFILTSARVRNISLLSFFLYVLLFCHELIYDPAPTYTLWHHIYDFTFGIFLFGGLIFYMVLLMYYCFATLYWFIEKVYTVLKQV
jgi:hypothetical protein